MKWAHTPITLYKIVRPNWMDDREVTSFEVLHHKHCLAYLPGQKVTTVQPAFFFLSRARAINYLTHWLAHVNESPLDAELRRCEAEKIYAPPSHVPPANAVDMFDLFWRTFFGMPEGRDTHGLFEGLEPVPHGTVMAFTFSIEDELSIPTAIRNLRGGIDS